MKRIFVSIIALFASSSCSTTIDNPPDRHLWSQLEYADCETDSALPVLDNLTGGLLLGWGVIGLAFANPLSILDIAAGGALVASGTNGNSKLKECEKLETHIANRKEREKDKKYRSNNNNDDEYYQTTERVIKTKEDDEEEKLKKQLRILELKKKIKKMNNEDY